MVWFNTNTEMAQNRESVLFWYLQNVIVQIFLELTFYVNCVFTDVDAEAPILTPYHSKS